jgi:class 3 adenylate cyclase
MATSMGHAELSEPVRNLLHRPAMVVLCARCTPARAPVENAARDSRSRQRPGCRNGIRRSSQTRQDDAEHRQLTVMFIDLLGSTALSTKLDLADLCSVIGAYHKCVAETVARFGGFVARARTYIMRPTLLTINQPSTEAAAQPVSLSVVRTVLPPVRPPAQQSFGTRLIETGLPGAWRGLRRFDTKRPALSWNSTRPSPR